MTESDKKYYDNREIERIKHARAVSKARYRGEKSEEWHLTNKLTPQTHEAFRKAMKEADKEWELLNR